MKIYRLTEYVTFGGSTRAIEKHRKVAALNKAGVETVVCLLRQDDPELREHFAYRHYPVPDSEHAALSKVAFQRATVLAQNLIEATSRQEHLHVHCQAGRNRSGLILSIYLILLGRTGEQALNELRHINPKILTNHVYEEYVRQLK